MKPKRRTTKQRPILPAGRRFAAAHLLGCPFCGALPKVLEAWEHQMKRWEWRVVCCDPYCIVGPATMWALNPGAAIGNWNARKSTAGRVKYPIASKQPNNQADR